MKKYAIIVIIIIISLGTVVLFTTTRNSPLQEYNITTYLNITPKDKSYTIYMSGTGTQQDNVIHLFQTLKSRSRQNEPLRDTTIALMYNIEKNELQSISVKAITGSEQLDYAYIIFIDDMIKTNLGKNLLSWYVSLGERKETHWLFSTSYDWTLYKKDATWNRQNIVFSFTSMCDIKYYFSQKKSCSLKGNFSISTPLNSGPILGEIQGNFSTSPLQ